MYILLDGLEECREREREELLRLVTDIARDARMDTHALVTIRQERDVERVMRRLKVAVVNMSCDEVAADISLHVRECLAKDRGLFRFPRDVKDRIERVLT